MLFKRIIFLFFTFLFTCNIYSYKRILYVDNFHSILGNYTSEQKLLSFSKRYGFNSLVLYGIDKIHKRQSLQNSKAGNLLAKFLLKAKSDFGIAKVAAVGETASFFIDIIDKYNNSRNSKYEKIDIYNLEFEYWSKNASSDGGYYCENYLKYNNYTCDRKGSFNHFLNDLQQLKKLSKNNSHNIKIEVFLGWFKENEIKQISKYTDRIIVQSYNKNPKTCYSTTKKRLSFLSKLPKHIETFVLFSSTMSNMGKWLKYDSLEKTENIFLNEMKTKNKNLAKKIKIKSFGYHSYSYLEKSLNYYAYRKN